MRSWRDAYPEILSAKDIESRTIDSRTDQWANTLETGEKDVSVAERAGEIVGFVSSGASDDDDAGQGVGEVAALYLVRDVWRDGIGRKLMEVALDCLRSKGFAQATLWVLRDNEPARSFYEKQGWSHDGGEKDCFAGFTAPALRYRIDLSR
jgi:ribosomal protein S18 acetylase RimI-like enzyme